MAPGFRERRIFMRINDWNVVSIKAARRRLVACAVAAAGACAMLGLMTATNRQALLRSSHPIM
jgi:hypothetical protein